MGPSNVSRGIYIDIPKISRRNHLNCPWLKLILFVILRVSWVFLELRNFLELKQYPGIISRCVRGCYAILHNLDNQPGFTSSLSPKRGK